MELLHAAQSKVAQSSGSWAAPSGNVVHLGGEPQTISSGLFPQGEGPETRPHGLTWGQEHAPRCCTAARVWDEGLSLCSRAAEAGAGGTRRPTSMVGTGTRSGVAPVLCHGVTGVAPGSAGARGASTAPGTGLWGEADCVGTLVRFR